MAVTSMRRREPTASRSDEKRRHVRLIAACTFLVWLTCAPAVAQEQSRLVAGALAGVSALSADARSVTSGPDAAVSLYDPGLGPAVNVFGGIHVAPYFSLQANWMWNRNDITLVSSFTTPQGGGHYQQVRHSDQHAFVLDGLIYFRGLTSAVRPYLGTGLAVVHFSGNDIVSSAAHGLEPPSGDIESTHIGLRSHVGIDFRLSRTVSFRYSFSETISGNPVGPSLTPPGQRGLMNFQNLFGFVARF
jgi:outer membrane protein W